MTLAVEINEKVYARFKAFGLRDQEIIFLLSISTNKLQRFKSDMDWQLYGEFENEFLNNKHTVRYKERIQ